MKTGRNRRQTLRRIALGSVGTVIVALMFFSAWALVRERDAAAAVAPANGTYVPAGDVRLFVQTAGEKGNPPILLVHGMAAWSETWRPVMERLANEGWYVISVDMPPFGFSERPANQDYWRVAQAARIDALLGTLEIPNAVIVGHSYGSRAVVETALRYPSRIRGLVLVDPALDAIYADSASDPSSVVKLLVPALVRYPVTASTMTNPLLSRTLLATFLYDRADASDAIVAVYRKPATLAGSTEAMGSWLRGFLTGKDKGLSSDRAAYKALGRTALIWGAEDKTTPLAQGEELRSLIPGATLSVIPGVGHIPHIEEPETFNTALIDALHTLKR